MNALLSKLHRALDDVSQGYIAIRFPTMLGQHLRNDVLERLDQRTLRKRLSDYAQVSGILVVPNTSQHCLVSMVNTQSNLDSLRR